MQQIEVISMWLSGMSGPEYGGWEGKTALGKHKLLSQTSIESTGAARTEGAAGDEAEHTFSQSPFLLRNKALCIGLGLISVALWSCGLSKPVATRRLCERVPGKAEREQCQVKRPL